MSTCDVLIKNKTVCSIRKGVLFQFVNIAHVSQSEAVLEYLKSLSISVNCSNQQKDILCSVIRTISSKLPSGRKRAKYLDTYYDWNVEQVEFLAHHLAEVQNELSTLKEQHDAAIKKNQDLTTSLHSANTENVRLKIQNENLKRRKKKYSLSRDIVEKPYSKTHQNRLKRQLKNEAAKVGLDLPSPSVTSPTSPAQASVMVDITNMSLRQYQKVTKFLPNTPKLHSIKKERTRYVNCRGDVHNSLAHIKSV